MKEAPQKIVDELKSLNRACDKEIVFIAKSYNIYGPNSYTKEQDQIISVNTNLKKINKINNSGGILGVKIGSLDWEVGWQWIRRYYINDKKTYFCMVVNTNKGDQTLLISIKGGTIPLYEKMVEELKTYFAEAREANQKQAAENAKVALADKILDQKKLLEAGIITQEEFEAKKKELLGEVDKA